MENKEKSFKYLEPVFTKHKKVEGDCEMQSVIRAPVGVMKGN